MAKSSPITALSKIAAALPDVEQGIACEGTAVESRTFKVNGKAFVFLRPGNAMVKLDASLEEAKKVSKGDPRVKPGSGGWTIIRLDDGGPPLPLMKQWITESFGLQAGAAKTPRKPAPRKKPKNKARG
jgi:hypothetical protein